MTAGKLYDGSANVASSSPLPYRVDELILGANNVGTTHRGNFGERGRHGPRISRLWSETIESGRRGVFATIGVEQCSSNVEIHPYRSQLRVRLTQPLSQAGLTIPGSSLN